MVVSEPLAQRCADGHLPVFAALGVAELQNPGARVDVAGSQQPGFGGTQAAGVDRAEQHRHDQVPQRNLSTVAAPVGLGEQGRQFLVGVDVRDVTGGPGQRASGQDVCRHAPATQPSGQLPHRRGQGLQGCRLDSALPRGRQPRLDRRLAGRAQPGKLAAAERGEPGQHPLFTGVLVTHGAFLRDQGRDRVSQRDVRAHREASRAGASGSRAHLASNPSDDFR